MPLVKKQSINPEAPALSGAGWCEMTLEEAKKVAAIVSEADGGCSVCVGCLVDSLRSAFPEFCWVFTEYEPVLVTQNTETAASSGAGGCEPMIAS